MRGQIEKRGDAYRIRWFLGRDANGKRQYGSKTVRGTKRQAEKALRDVLGRADKGYAVPSPSRIPTLRDYLEQWKQGEAAAKLRARTLRDYLETLGRHVLPKLGGARLDAIHTARIEAELVAPLRAAGKLRSAQLAVSALSKVYGSALKDPTLGLVGNPCRGVEVGRRPAERVAPLSADERTAFRAAIQGTEHEVLFLLLMLTGLSPHEALGVGWEHLELETGELRVMRTVDTKTRALVENTKRESRRRAVPLVPELRRLLGERWLAAGRPPAGLIFGASDGRPLHLDTLRACHFRPALERAGIKRRVTLYALRHGFATAALEAGADVKTVSELMGHRSTAMVQQVYQHVSDERKREAAELVARRLAGEGPTAFH